MKKRSLLGTMLTLSVVIAAVVAFSGVTVLAVPEGYVPRTNEEIIAEFEKLPDASYSLALSDITLTHSAYTDLKTSFTELKPGRMRSYENEGEWILVDKVSISMEGGTLSDGNGHSLDFGVCSDHGLAAFPGSGFTVGPFDGTINESNGFEETYPFSFSVFIIPSDFDAAEPGTYTGTLNYTSTWTGYSFDSDINGTPCSYAGGSGSITVTVTVPDHSDGSILEYGSCGNGIDWSLDSNGTLTITGTGNMPDYSHEDEMYFSIPWAHLRSKIKSVVIGEGITSVGDYAFYTNRSMESVSIASSVKKIGDYSFSLCQAVKTISLPDTLVSIGKHAFSSCEDLQTINIPGSVTEIGPNAFSYCADLSSPITIPEGVKVIHENAFLNCYSLSSITLPDGLDSIDYNAFQSCPITSINIPDSVTYIGNWAFSSTDLTEVTIPSGVTEINVKTFYACDKLETVILPEGLTKIKGSAFENCSKLKTITIPASVQSIGVDSFFGCKCKDIYCYANPENLIWRVHNAEFITNGDKTVCHVPFRFLDDYESLHDNVNVTYAGDLDVIDMGIGEHLYGYSLSLEGDIGVDFYMRLDDVTAASEDAKMVFTIRSLDGTKTRTQEVYVNDQGDENVPCAYLDGDFFIFECRVAAKEMTSEITAQMVCGDKKGLVYTYSVQDYAKYILDHADEYADEQDVVKAMLNYGAYSQLYFNYNLDNLANSVMDEAEQQVSIIDVSELRAFSGSTVVGPCGLTLKSANLELESETVLNLYFTGVEGCDHLNFKINDDLILPCTFSDDGTGKTIAKVTIRNIPIHFINNDFKIDVYEGTGYAGSITYSPMNYCYNVISREITATRTEALKLDISAYVLFYQKSIEYCEIL